MERSLEALPGRYYDIQALFHGFNQDFSWDNGEATRTSSAAVLNLFLWLDWILFFLFAYMTIINYSYFIAAKTTISDYSNYSLS